MSTATSSGTAHDATVQTGPGVDIHETARLTNLVEEAKQQLAAAEAKVVKQRAHLAGAEAGVVEHQQALERAEAALREAGDA